MTEMPTPTSTPAQPVPGSGMRIAIYIVPLVVLLLLVWLFFVGLGRDPRNLPSALLNQPLPDFALEALPDRGRPLTRDALLGEVSLLNVFGSWCVACQYEHPILLLIKEDGEVRVHGIDWKEKNAQDGASWLARHGDPYDLVGNDPDSRLAIDLGVTGAPETYVVDTRGVVRYKHIGPITPENWHGLLRPIVMQLKAEGEADGTLRPKAPDVAPDPIPEAVVAPDTTAESSADALTESPAAPVSVSEPESEDTP